MSAPIVYYVDKSKTRIKQKKDARERRKSVAANFR